MRDWEKIIFADTAIKILGVFLVFQIVMIILIIIEFAFTVAGWLS